MREQIPIRSRDFWFKIVGMLQQNWALIDSDESGAIIHFVHDGSGVFDRLSFGDEASAESALERNGFDRYDQDSEAAQFISPPQPPFSIGSHPNGAIYSSGQYWR